jgi:hypothetical protein
LASSSACVDAHPVDIHLGLVAGIGQGRDGRGEKMLVTIPHARLKMKKKGYTEECPAS